MNDWTELSLHGWIQRLWVAKRSFVLHIALPLYKYKLAVLSGVCACILFSLRSHSSSRLNQFLSKFIMQVQPAFA
jgi:hypothetical protein